MEAVAAYSHLYFPQVHINWVSLIPSQEWQLQGRPDIALHWNWEWHTLGGNGPQVLQQGQKIALVLSPEGLALFFECSVLVEQKQARCQLIHCSDNLHLGDVLEKLGHFLFCQDKQCPSFARWSELQRSLHCPIPRCSRLAPLHVFRARNFRLPLHI